MKKIVHAMANSRKGHFFLLISRRKIKHEYLQTESYAQGLTGVSGNNYFSAFII